MIGKGKLAGHYVLTCDSCGREAAREFGTFSQAMRYRNEAGWESGIRKNGEQEVWKDICPGCRRKGATARELQPEDAGRPPLGG